MPLETGSARPSLTGVGEGAAERVRGDHGLPGRLRRQPRGSGRRFAFPVTTALDEDTFEVLNAVSLQRRVTRSLVVENVLRDWAERVGRKPNL